MPRVARVKEGLGVIHKLPADVARRNIAVSFPNGAVAMEPTTVFAKTPLGHDEIATRARHLPARVRAMLIMIDGRHSVAQLLTGHPAPGEAETYLRQLLDGGFIEAA